jgi:hypothetical protein
LTGDKQLSTLCHSSHLCANAKPLLGKRKKKRAGLPARPTRSVTTLACALL